MRAGNRIQRFVAAAALVTSAASLSGCKFISWFRDGGASASPAGELAAMPRVTYTDLDKTGRKLASAGMKVVVLRKELTVRPKGNGELSSFTVPASSRLFEAGEWNHMIAAQDPPAGAALPPGSTVTLTAGLHHGAGPFRPWLDAHPASVKVRGEQRCRDCHLPSYCSECHGKAKVTAKR